ncbi:restriction endonuclease subunit S [Nostoc sp.]|uniref:restriction endonuclease subunit S n=1 Tax=Nostoc sp. TaxID=1180 RepID=UPI002FF5ED31
MTIWLNKSINNLFEKIDNHFAEAPFEHIRIASQKWQYQNFQMLTQVSNFASSVNARFTPDEGYFTPDCFSTDVYDRIAEAAKAMDTSGKRKTTKNQTAWAKLFKAVYKYFDKFVTFDLSNDPDARQVVKQFLKSLLAQNDENLSLIALIDKYLDDIESVGEINDVFGKFPGKEKPEPFAYANAWWVFGEVMEDTAFRYGVFLAEAEEIGYKRGKGNRYQPRRNDLFRCDDPNDLLNTIHPDDTDTILGCLREHIRKKKAYKQPTIVGGFVTESLNIARQLSLRPDPKYRFFWDIQHGISLPEATAPQMRLCDCLLPYAPRMIAKGELNEERKILELADIEGRTSIILVDEEGNERKVIEVGSTKLDLADCDLAITRLRPYLGKVVLNDLADPYIGTSEWIPLKLRTSLLNRLFVKYLLLLPQNLTAFRQMMGGKQHPRIRQEDLNRLRIPVPSLNIQQTVAKQLEELEQKLIEKQRSLSSRPKVIDAIFADEFNYTLNDYRAKAGNFTYERSIDEFGRSLDLRGGVRFHHPKFDPLDTMFTNVERCLFREVIIPFVRLGATIHPEDYDEDGEAYYISPAVIKTYTCDLNSAQTLTDSYYKSNSQQFGLRENDLVIARSGEGTIGKAALFTDDSPCIYSDFTMRVRFNQRILPEFGYYFCCSKLFHLQVEKLKRGMGNMTNFFPGQLLRFWIACPSPERQKDIVERVRIALDEFDAQRDEVERLRNEIDAVVLRSLMVD